MNAAEASVKDFRRVGMWTVFEGAVLGRWSAKGRGVRVANEGLRTGVVVGIGSEAISGDGIESERNLPCDSS